MENKIMKAIGVLRYKEDVYMILEKNTTLFPEDMCLNSGDVMFEVVHRMFIETTEEGIVITGKEVFVTPRWITLPPGADYIIEWFPTPKTIDVHMGWGAEPDFID